MPGATAGSASAELQLLSGLRMLWQGCMLDMGDL